MAFGLLSGDLVRLRELREEDLGALVGWWNDPATAVRQVTGPVHPRPAADVAAMFRAWSQNVGGSVGLAVVTRDKDELVGHVTLYGADPKERCATLAIIIGAPHQGRGLGTDAVRVLVDYGFTELGLHRIELAVNGDNTPALAAYRRAGFREEGRRREAVFRHGGWHDEIRMGILAREHEQSRAYPQHGPEFGAAADGAVTDGATTGAAGLRVEVFAEDLDAFADFYTRVLGFVLSTDQRAAERPYAAVALGGVRIGAARPWSPVSRDARAVPTGVEIVVEVADVDAAYRRARESGWPLEAELRQRPWGLTDFRLRDPDGYYLRITSR